MARVTIREVFQEIQAMKEMLQRHTEADDRNFAELRRLFEGTDNAPGMKIRMDRVEQTEAGRKRGIGYVWAAISALVVALLTKLWIGQ